MYYEKRIFNRRFRMCNYFVAEFSLARYDVTFANNSVININLVGEGYPAPNISQTDAGALECHTDDTTCCTGRNNPHGGGRGDWYYPDGTVVPPPDSDGFYRTRDHMVIRLNRGGSIYYPLTNWNLSL